MSPVHMAALFMGKCCAANVCMTGFASISGINWPISLSKIFSIEGLRQPCQTTAEKMYALPILLVDRGQPMSNPACV